MLLLVRLSDFVSREKHAAIRIDSNGNAFIEDLKRSIGIYVNGRLVHSQQLKPFDENRVLTVLPLLLFLNAK